VRLELHSQQVGKRWLEYLGDITVLDGERELLARIGDQTGSFFDHESDTVIVVSWFRRRPDLPAHQLRLTVGQIEVRLEGYLEA
jgi:hypothetical protein